MDLNPDDFRAPVEFIIDTSPQLPAKGLPHHQKGEKFLKGPIPWAWLQSAMHLKGKALHVALVLWREAGISNKPTVRFNLSAQEKNGILRDAARGGLRALEAAKLVAVAYHPGQALEVTLLEATEEAVAD